MMSQRPTAVHVPLATIRSPVVAGYGLSRGARLTTISPGRVLSLQSGRVRAQLLRHRSLKSRKGLQITSAKSSDGDIPEWIRKRDARLEAELEEIEEKIAEKGAFGGLILKMRRDSSKQGALDQQLQAAADKKFQGLRKWKFVFEDLRKWRIKSVDAAEVAREVSKGNAVLLDIREPRAFETNTATGAVNVPLYTSGIVGDTPWDLARKAAFTAFAMEGTERNPEFVSAVDALVGKGGGIFKRKPRVYVMCGIGGSLETSEERIAQGKPPSVYGDYGNASRSFMAIHDLYSAGYTNVAHLKGGFSQYKVDGLPVTGAPSPRANKQQ
ncbi:hypothetical protein CYMTET_53111 [Cymbomonas tetramitiformis]|uniref:Rhodanese domain-containing protein n=1 Tax=Cymbomonas tetramitiformis TaxID=36881 RepID=A0AAE0BJ24_9CHLO|nr:hypothetical protein CYMTET_53111 [Cymbomonas tetramitiformis]